MIRTRAGHREVSVGAVREAAARGLRIGALADEFNVARICMAEFCARHRIEVAIDQRRFA
jgi:hypothetical protein